MEENKSLDYVLFFMKNLNLVIILYISMLIFTSISGCLRENTAGEFLARAGSLPITAWKLPVMALCLYICCLILMQMKEVRNLNLILKVSVEVVISFWLSYILGFCYTGTVLLVLADTMKQFPKSTRKISFAVGIFLLYLLFNFDLLSVYFHMTSLEVYLEYFQSDVRSALLGTVNALGAMNTFVFLVYMILLVRRQMSEKEKIMSLNEQLNTANVELHRANVRLEEYAKESERLAEARERNRLAREIHDTLGHALTGIITGIDACKALMEVAPEAANRQLSAIADVARQGLTDVRRSIKALRPDALEKLELEQALLQVINKMHVATNAEISFQCSARLNGFNEDEENIIYRIVQECITNSIRHGQADKIRIRIDREYNMLKIYIKDNGIGCKDIKEGFGLHHMKERLNMLQGKLEYSSRDGFAVEAQIPVRWGTEEEKDDQSIDSR